MQPTVYCGITFFLSYPRTLIPSIPSVTFVTDDDDTGIGVLSGQFTAFVIPRPDTWGHGYRIDDWYNDLDNDGGGDSGGAVTTA